jgi:hypothetical protein
MEILISKARSLERMRAAAAWMLFAFWAGLCSCNAAAAEGDSMEYAIKAAYLYKFGIYVEWPQHAFPSPTSPLYLCIVGEDPFGAALDAAVNGQRIETHPIVIRRVKTLARDTVCHILYANAADLQHVETARNGVLTVSDARGGIINFIIKDNRVRFDIDDEAAAQSGLNISSKLLGIALNVKPRKGK